MIFDDAFIAGLPEVNHYYNPHVVALCRMDHLKPLREQVEAWFLNVPENEQADMKARLRSKDDGQHLGAFYELMLHQFCLEEEWTADLHHVLDGGLTPDIKITTKEKDEALLEVYTQLDDEDFRKNAVVTNKLNDAINKLNTPFLLGLHYQENPPLDTNIRTIAGHVQTWLDSLDSSSSQEFELNLDSVGVDAKVSAKLEDDVKLVDGGCLFSISGPAQSGLPGVGKVNNKLKAKRKKYASSKTDLPLVVAVCDGTSRSWWGETTIDRALFGHPTITFAIDGSDEQPKAGRDGKGLITPHQTKEGYFAENKGISAVLYCSRIQPERGVIQYKMLVFHNPWAYVPLPERIFDKIPQLLVTKNDESGVAMEWNKENHGDFSVFFT